MANKRKKANFSGYALSYLTPEVQAQIKGNLLTPKALVEFIGRVVDDGYKFAVQWDDRNEAYSASLYGQFLDGDNAGLMLAIRHSDPQVAISALQVIHDDVYEHEWPQQADTDW